ncbi:MAG: CHASE2 domain-containing protein [Pseudomonadota bacterium]
MKKIFRLNPYKISFLITVIGLIGYLVGLPILDLMELKTIDLRFRFRGNITASPDVALAVIDEKSVNEEGKWVWPRSKIAALIDKLDASGARVIGFDIGFLEPDDQRVVTALSKLEADLATQQLSNEAIAKIVSALKTQTDEDALLAEAIKRSKAKIVLGYFFHMGDVDLRHVDEATIQQHTENIKGGSHKFVRYASAEAQRAPLIAAQMPQSNIAPLAAATRYAGFFNMIPDEDGVVRWIPAVVKFRDTLYAPLSFMAASAYWDEPLSVSVADTGVESVNIGIRSAPTDEYGRVLINYHGPQETFPHLSITDILHDQIPREAIENRIILVGATAVGIYDLRVTPFGNVFPGLEVHANMVSSILESDYLHKPGWGAIFDIMGMVSCGFLLGFILARTGVIAGGVAAGVFMTIYILVCLYLFSSRGLVVNMVYPLTVLLLTYSAITAYKYLTESQQKKFIKDAFSTYMAPAVVKQLIDSPESLVLGGEEREITAFFSDVQGFTSISESLTPAELVELLNEFLTEMTDVILAHEGTVDKFEGDAIIAFFGAPNVMENHAEVACMSCIDMQLRLEKLRRKWRSEGKPELHMRIGLASGLAVVGNMGSKNRMDYTMMGDTVNTAARLEGVNKVYGIYTLISDATRQAAGDIIVTREIDAINVVGKGLPITIYEILGYSGNTDAQLLQVADEYSLGLAAYRQRDWNRAIIHFNKALSIAPADGPSKTLLKRCNEFKQSPPTPDWNGAFAMTHK